MHLIFQCPKAADSFIIKMKFIIILKIVTSINNKISLINNESLDWLSIYYDLTDVDIINQINPAPNSKWDILVILNYDGYRKIQRVFLKLPVIALLLEAKDGALLYNFPKLLHILDTNTIQFPYANSNIFKHQISHHQLPVDFLKIKSTLSKKFTLTYVYDTSDVNFVSCSKIIKVLNLLSADYEIKIWVFTQDQQLFFASAVNDYIKCVIIDRVQYVSNNESFIASGEIAEYLINKKLNVIIAGQNGLNGIYNDDDKVRLKETFYLGRIGGTYDELIPQPLLFNEIETLASQYRRSKRDKAKYISKETGTEEIHQKIMSLLDVFSSYKRNETLLKLYPKKHQEILIHTVEENSVYLLVNRLTAKIITSISIEEKVILDLCDGNNNSHEIANLVPMFPEKEILQFIRSMFVSKLVSFNKSNDSVNKIIY